MAEDCDKACGILSYLPDSRVVNTMPLNNSKRSLRLLVQFLPLRKLMKEPANAIIGP